MNDKMNSVYNLVIVTILSMCELGWDLQDYLKLTSPLMIHPWPMLLDAWRGWNRMGSNEPEYRN